MLCISRKPGEKVRIGDAVVTVLAVVSRNRVRLGIEAPDEVNIAREELAKDTRTSGNGMPARRGH